MSKATRKAIADNKNMRSMNYLETKVTMRNRPDLGPWRDESAIDPGQVAGDVAEARRIIDTEIDATKIELEKLRQKAAKGGCI